MELLVRNVDNLSGTPEVIILNGEDRLVFNISSFGKPAFRNFDVFEQLNKYISGLSPTSKDTLFGLYADIWNTFNSVWEPNDLSIQLNHKVASLLNFFDFDTINQWVVFQSSIFIPNTFATEYVESIDNNNSRDQTYIKNDYSKLVTLALILRAMIPVWGEFISQTRQNKGTTFKEYYAYQLISTSNLAKCETVEKLQLYIECMVGSEADSHSTVISGVSSEDFPLWILGLVAVRRLCIGDIRGIDPRANLVTFIYAFIKQKTSGNENSGANIIKNKNIPDSSTDSDAKLSALERYKIKSTISIGEIVGLEVSIRDLKAIAFGLSENMTEDLYKCGMKCAKELLKHAILEPQIILMQWIFKPVISPRGLMHVPKETIVECMGVTYAVLWARGHHYLALLAVAYSDNGMDEMHVSGVDSRARIPKETSDIINTLYPYFKRTGNKRTQIKPVNMALYSVDLITEELSLAVWNTTADIKHINQFFGTGQGRRIPINHSIKVDLANLLIELGGRNWK